MAWTTTTHSSGSLSSASWNAGVADNLQFLHDGNGAYLSGPSDDIGTNVGIAVNACIMVPVITRDAITITKIGIKVDTASGHLDCGIFSDDGNGQTISKVATSDLTVMPGAGPQAITLENPAVLAPLTKYWMVIGFDSANSRIRGTDGPAGLIARHTESTPNVKVMPLPTLIKMDNSLGLAPCMIGIP